MLFRLSVPFAMLGLLFAAPSRAQDALVTYKSLSPELALDLARAALGECRKRGFESFQDCARRQQHQGGSRINVPGKEKLRNG